MEDIIDISNINKLEPEKGRVLISEPFMQDNYFKRSVVYLCEHNEDGSFGFVVNNLLTVTLSELVTDIESSDFPVSFGGPVNSNNLFYLHNLGDKIANSHEVVPGLYTGGSFDDVKTLINTGIITSDQIRFFLGYSGWESGQLEEEMKSNSWIVGSTSIKNVLENKDKDLWKQILKNMGGKFKMISNFPEDPSLN